MADASSFATVVGSLKTSRGVDSGSFLHSSPPALFVREALRRKVSLDMTLYCARHCAGHTGIVPSSEGAMVWGSQPSGVSVPFLLALARTMSLRAHSHGVAETACTSPFDWGRKAWLRERFFATVGLELHPE